MRLSIPLLALSLGLLIALGALGLGASADEPGQAPEVGPDVGQRAPDFRLNQQDGKALRLSDHGTQAWTLLAFYPKAATPG